MTQGVNGAGSSAYAAEVARLNALIAAAGTDESKRTAAQQELLKFVSDNPDPNKYVALEKGPEGTPEQREARGAANNAAVAEMAALKSAATTSTPTSTTTVDSDGTTTVTLPEVVITGSAPTSTTTNATTPNTTSTPTREETVQARVNEVKENGVQAGRVNVTSQQGVVYDTDLSIAQKEQIEGHKQYTDKDNVKQEFSQGALPEAEWEQLQKDYDLAKDTLKAAQKKFDGIKRDDYNSAEEFGAAKNAAQAERDAAAEREAELRVKHDEQKVLQRMKDGKGAGGITKAAKRNIENWQNVDNRQYVYMSKEEEEAAIAADPSLKGQTAHLDNDDINTLFDIQSYAKYQIKKAKESGSEDAIAKAEADYGQFANIFETDENGNLDYSKIDTRKVQNALVDLSGADQRFNMDEVDVFAKQIGAKKGDVRSFVKKFGFGTEKGLAAKWKAAGIAFGAAAAGNALNALLGNTHSHRTAEASATAQGETVQGEISWIASNGEEFYKFYEAKGGDAAVSVVADACAKLPVAGQLLGPALAGVTAFLLTKGQTEDAFKGNVEAVLKDINLVEGDDNKAIVLQIQNMEITGDKAQDDLIKASVLKAAIGGDTKKANTEELLAAYDSIKDVKKVIEQIPVQQPTPPVQVVTPPPPPEPPKPIERTEDVAKDFNVKHRSGMGPYQYAEALGIPAKDRMAFVRQFQEDNNLNKAGTKYNKTPLLRKEYELNGRKYEIDQDTAQKKIDEYNVPQSNVKGKWTSTNNRAIIMQNGHWIYSDSKQRVPDAELAKHPTYKDYCEKHPDEPGKQGVKPEEE